MVLRDEEVYILTMGLNMPLTRLFRRCIPGLPLLEERGVFLNPLCESLALISPLPYMLVP